ncbi:MAG: hypothetical protein AB1706_18960 [Pseudomonadota bacterium]
MLIDKISPNLFSYNGYKINKVSGVNSETQMASNHVPSIGISFSGDMYDERFIKSGGFNFNGSKLNYLA